MYQERLEAQLLEYFPRFGKEERPFGEPKQVYPKFQFVDRSKTYSLRNIPYREIFDRMHGQVRDNNVEEALRCAQMKKLMLHCLTGKVDEGALGDIAELALDQGHNEIAIQYA